MRAGEDLTLWREREGVREYPGKMSRRGQENSLIGELYHVIKGRPLLVVRFFWGRFPLSSKARTREFLFIFF